MAKVDNLKTENVTFVCIKCGECCRHIEAFVEIMPRQHNGICDFLHGDICAIYENRPDLCDYKRAYTYFADYLTEDEYKKKVIEVCEELKRRKHENRHPL